MLRDQNRGRSRTPGRAGPVLCAVLTAALLLSGCGAGPGTSWVADVRERTERLTSPVPSPDARTPMPSPGSSTRPAGYTLTIGEARKALPTAKALDPIAAESVRYRVRSPEFLEDGILGLTLCPGRDGLDLPVTAEAKLANNVVTPRTSVATTFRMLFTFVQVFPDTATTARYMRTYRAMVRKCGPREVEQGGVHARNTVVELQRPRWSGPRIITTGTKSPLEAGGRRYPFLRITSVVTRGNAIVYQSYWRTPRGSQPPPPGWREASRSGARRALVGLLSRLPQPAEDRRQSERPAMGLPGSRRPGAL